MTGIVLVTHGRLGQALLETAESVLNEKVESIAFVSVDPKQPAAKLRSNISKAISNADQGQGVLVLTDMFGGTPCNLGYSFLEENQVEVLSGVNLPVLLRAIMLREGQSLSELADEVAQYGQKSISLASEILRGNKKSA